MLYRMASTVVAVIMLMVLFTATALAQDPANGKVIWEEQSGCQRCHGPAAEGLWAGPLAGTERTAAEFIQQSRTPRRNMPAFSAEQISDTQLTDIHAYLTTLTKPAAFTPIDPGLPADAPAGQKLLAEKRCAACHSIEGPVKGFVERGEMPTIEAIAKQVHTPRRNMPSFSTTQVSDEEIAQITDFLVQQYTAQQATMAAEAPATLPATGGQPFNWPAALFAMGALILAMAYLLRRWAA